MTLREAFLVLAPEPLQDPEAEARRREALTIVYEAVQACADRMGGDARFRQLAQEEASAAFLRLLAGGPRHGDAERWKTEEEVGGYLYRAVENAVKDRLRKERREVGTELDHVGLPTTEGAEGPIEKEPASVQRLFERIRRDVVPLVGSDRSRQALIARLEELLALALRETKLDALIEKELGRAPDDDDECNRTRDRLYQRHFRARKKLLLAAERALRAGRIGARFFEQVKSFVAALARRRV